MSAPSTNTLFDSAVSHHQRGELDKAVPLYQQILQNNPDHTDSLHLLGLACMQRGAPQKAVELIERAVARNPTIAVYHGNLAEAYRLSGQVKKAIASFQVALRLQPAAAEVANNFGSLLMQQRMVGEAVKQFQAAVKHKPDFAVAHNNLGNAYRVLGDANKAVTHFLRAVQLNPKLGYAHGNLGQMLLDCGKLEEALPHCQEAVRLQPQSAASRNNLGNVYRKMGNLIEAKAQYLEAMRLAPNLAIVQNNIGQVLFEEGKYDEATTWYRQALQLEPNNVRFRFTLAASLLEQHKVEEAEEQLVTGLKVEPQNVEGLFYLAKLRFEQGRLEESVATYRAVLRVQPTHPLVNLSLGEVLLELNHQDEAMTCFRQSLKGNPRFAPPYAHLATHLRDKLPAEDREAMTKLLADPKLPESERVPILFGLAQLNDAERRYDVAAEYLEKANAMEKKIRTSRGQVYNAEAHVRFVDRLLTVFTPPFFERVKDMGSDSERPIFIVGLPRSGTTLLEQIVASHSRVFGAGEQRFSRDGFELLGGGSDGAAEAVAFDKLEVIDRETVQDLAQRHLKKLEELNTTADHVIDKMPDNYMYVGFLHMMFPKARFLHCRRDLRDIAVSCWITQFRAIRWSNDREHIASRFQQYQRIVEHWSQVLPGLMLDVDYEDLVNDLEGTARRVLDFCGLEWEQACLDYHKSKRPIRTASVTQVRQPIYRRSVARWKNYEHSLRSLFELLEPSAATVTEQQPVGV